MDHLDSSKPSSQVTTWGGTILAVRLFALANFKGRNKFTFDGDNVNAAFDICHYYYLLSHFVEEKPTEN